MTKNMYFMLIIIALLAGCTSNPGPDFSNPRLPDNFSSTTYVIEGESPEKLESVTINHTSNYDLFEQWKKRQEKLNEQARYEMIRDSIEDDELKQKETEIEEYCNSLHSNTCLQMTQLAYDSGCREVEVTCGKNDTDDICIEYEVDISEEMKPAGEC